MRADLDSWEICCDVLLRLLLRRMNREQCRNDAALPKKPICCCLKKEKQNRIARAVSRYRDATSDSFRWNERDYRRVAQSWSFLGLSPRTFNPIDSSWTPAAVQEPLSRKKWKERSIGAIETIIIIRMIAHCLPASDVQTWRNPGSIVTPLSSRKKIRIQESRPPHHSHH